MKVENAVKVEPVVSLRSRGSGVLWRRTTWWPPFRKRCCHFNRQSVSLDNKMRFIARRMTEMAQQRTERRLAAILASDVAGYSKLMGADEEDTLTRLNVHRLEFLEPKIAEHRGRIVKRTGDGVLIEFASAVDATRCAVEIQRGMTDRNAEVPAERRIDFRIGIHVGDIIVEENDIFGDGVTSRLGWKVSRSLGASRFLRTRGARCKAR